jgi:hypothetical protein
MNIQEQIKELEKQQAAILRKKAALEAKAQEVSELDKKLDDIVNNSGFKTPKALISALVAKYGKEKVGGIKRARITAEVRDAVKSKIAAGMKKVTVAKEVGISYPAVMKIAKGDYDNL